MILKKNNIRKNRYPEYIYQTEGNVDIQKNYFRNIASSYVFDNNSLCIKYYYNNKNNSESYDKISKYRRKSSSYKLVRIPFEKNIINYLTKLPS